MICDVCIDNNNNILLRINRIRKLILFNAMYYGM